MQATLTRFIRMLRSHDLRISPAETLDAMAVASTLGYSDRDRLRDGLALSLAKTPEEEAILLRCFDQYFQRESAGTGPSTEEPAGGAEQAADSLEGAPATSEPAASRPADGAREVLEASAREVPELAGALDGGLLGQLLANDRAALSLAMERAATSVGLSDIQLFTQKGLFARRMLDAMGEEQLRDAILALEQRGDPALELLRRYRDSLREQVRDHVERSYLMHAEGHQRQFMDDLLSRTRLSNLERRYVHEVHTLIRKMARKLATRHARRSRPRRRGQLDMARTLRRGVAHDGVLFNTYWRRTRKEKTQLLAVCDVSGSVAAYAKFLLLFLYSLQDVLPKVRSFAFSSHLGEVSELFRDYPVEKAIELVNWRYGGATDYANSLQDFARLALDDINSGTTVIILGDARNNGGEPRVDILQSIYQRARRVIWLNPESRRAWGTGDSEMHRYQSACHFAAECNNLKQLERIVDQLLKMNR